MKQVKMVVEIDLGLEPDDYPVTKYRCEQTVSQCGLINAPFTTLQITTTDLDSGLINNVITVGDNT